MKDEKGIEPQDKVTKPEPPKPLEVEIPEKIVKILKDLDKKRRNLINTFVTLSFQVVDLQKRQTDTRNQINKTTEDVNGKVEFAFGKLKLKKKVDYRWSYDAKNVKFIGILKPKPKKEEKKPEQGK